MEGVKFALGTDVYQAQGLAASAFMQETFLDLLRDHDQKDVRKHIVACEDCQRIFSVSSDWLQRVTSSDSHTIPTSVPTHRATCIGSCLSL